MGNFGQKLVSWFEKNKRSLPWREDKNPYFIWLSEVILQQTRVEQGLPYFEKFRAAYPTIRELADAEIDEILKLWQGLGYYSRARNLHSAAKMVRDNYNELFPDSYEQIIKLKGVGDYTAAAIASIAFEEAVPVVDGNVFRLTTRYFGIQDDIQKSSTKVKIKSILQSEMDHQRPGDFNQAMMEYGSLVCTPKNPQCETCVISSGCYAFSHKMTDKLPIKKKKTRIKKRFFNYLVLEHNEQTLVRKRNEKDIWQGLYEFPLIESDQLFSADELLQRSEQVENTMNISQFELSGIYDLPKHILSHQHIHSRFFIISGQFAQASENLIPKGKLSEYPVSRMIDKFLESQPEFLSKKS